MDQIWDSFFSNEFPDFIEKFGINVFEKHSYPKVDILDEEDRVVINAEIPGLKKEEVKVQLKNGFLSICGEKRTENQNKKEKYIRRELKHSSFRRSFQIKSGEFKEDEIDAIFDNGMLSVSLPRLTKKDSKDGFKEIEIK